MKENSNIEEAIYSDKKRHFSTVWIVPITALILGIAMLINTWSNKGPTVTIKFKSATGIEAGKSVVKYKDIVVGHVKKVNFDKDLKSVLITAELDKEMAPYLSENTRFWIVHARLSASSVEGLDTLLSGAYIGIEPKEGNQKIKVFKGLQDPPVVTEDSVGKRFVLEAEDRGSLQAGSPIYYKKINVGSVVSYHLSKDANSVLIDIFIKSPYDKLVKETTKFWNASGIDATISADGVNIRTESLSAILSGGIAFENLDRYRGLKPKEAKEYAHFKLYKDYREAKEIHYDDVVYFWVYFKHSIRGLKQGSSVEFRGIKIGEVVDYRLIGDIENTEFEVPILIKIEPGRFNIRDKNGSESRGRGINIDILKKLIAKGFRAQLQSGNLLTGEMFINLDFFKDVPPAELKKMNGYYVIPTVPATIEKLKNDIQTLLDRLAKIPFEDIGKNLNDSMEILKTQTLPEINRATKNAGNILESGNETFINLNKKTLPELDKTLKSIETMISSIKNNYTDRNSQLNIKLIKLLDEITKTSRSIKNLVDYLERHPESVIRGR